MDVKNRRNESQNSEKTELIYVDVRVVSEWDWLKWILELFGTVLGLSDLVGILVDWLIQVVF